MRVALIADPHGNAPALRAVLNDAQEMRAEACWCLGDVFGRGPLPVSCMKLLLGAGTQIFLRGNHDESVFRLWNGAASTDYELRRLTPGLGDLAVAAWHAAQLKQAYTSDQVQPWTAWPTWRLACPGICAAHGAVLSEDKQSIENISGERSYLRPGNSYVAHRTRDIARALQTSAGKATWLVVVGHSHWQSWATFDPRQGATGAWVWQEDTLPSVNQEEPVDLGAAGTDFVILCPGAVGQSRNAFRDLVGTERDLRAQYALLDTERRLVWFRRVEYDLSETLAAMVPFPPEFARVVETALREQREALLHIRPNNNQ